MKNKIIEEIIFSLSKKVEKENFKWYDLIDIKEYKIIIFLLKIPIINSILNVIILRNFSWLIRKLFSIKKRYSFKWLWLFLRSYCNLYLITKNKKYLENAIEIAKILEKNISEWYSWIGWGNNYNWQSKIFIPKKTPCIVVSSICWQAFIDLYEITKNEKHLNIAIGVKDFILNDMKLYNINNTVCTSYTPIDNMKILNASIKWWNFLSRIYKYKKEEKIKELSIKILKYILNEQNINWSFYYFSKEQYPNWSQIDNYHTWFVLESIYETINNLNINNNNINTQLKKWLDFYINNLISNKTIPINNINNPLPIDIHWIAQSIITLHKLRNIDDNSKIINNITQYTIKNFWDNKNNYFYYLKYEEPLLIRMKEISLKNKIINFLTFKKIDKTHMIRWSSWWMLYALTLLEVENIAN